MKSTSAVLWLVFQIITLAVLTMSDIPNGYFKWKDPTQNRTDLVCPCTNLQCEDQDDVNKKCRCRAKPVWEISNDESENVYLEYHSRRGIALIVSPDSQPLTKPLILEHKDEFLSQIPENICSYENLVKVDFSRNRLTKLEHINCLSHLDTLILQENHINTIHNETFLGMSNLRVLDLSMNRITHLDPQTLSDSSIGMYLVDFSHNQLTQLDITNVVIRHPFCEIDYNNNQIVELTNLLPIQFDAGITFGEGGFVNFQSNAITEFPDFTKLGVADLTQLGKIFGFGFDFRGCKFTCDCVMVPFLELSRDVIKKIWRDYFDIKCFNPPELANQSIAWLTKEGQLDQFICNISKSENCPGDCHCYKQPSHDRTVVNCTNLNMMQLPLKLPADTNITLIMTGNQVTQVENRSYFDRVSVLELSDNKIKNIPESIAKTLVINEVKLDLYGNQLTSIPSVFKITDPCDLNIGMINQTCDCDVQWEKEWFVSRYSQVCDKNRSTSIYCITPSGYVPIAQFNFQDLDCLTGFNFKNLTIGIAILLLLLTAALVSCHYFRYEIFLLPKRLKVPRKHRGQFKHDVYISVRENHQPAISWIQHTLLPSLKAQNYNPYFGPVDETFGTVKEEEIISKIKESRNYLVVLSSDYTDEDDDSIWTNLEWKHIWNSFKEESRVRNIIIINYDQLRATVFPIGPFKAYLRLGLAIDFANRKHKILEEIRERLGLPNHNLPKFIPPMPTVYTVGEQHDASSKPLFTSQWLIKSTYSTLTDPDLKTNQDDNDCNLYIVSEEITHAEPSVKYDRNFVDVEQSGFYSLSNHRAPTLIHISI